MTKNIDIPFDLNEWTLDDQRFLQNNSARLTARQIAQTLDRPLEHVQLFATSCNITLKKSDAWSIEESEFLEKNTGNLTIKQLADHLGRSVQSVYYRKCIRPIKEKGAIWAEKEDQIVIDNWYLGIPVILKELSKAGYTRKQGAVVKRGNELHIGTARSNWNKAAMCPQMHFFTMLCYRYATADKDPQLTYPILAKLTYTPLEKIQKMFMSGPNQEPMTIEMRHHFWVVVGLENKKRHNVARARKLRKSVGTEDSL